MSVNSKEKQCVVCKAYLFEDDDVVHCPTCGAPHHRDCYKSVGHCGLEELHGTENQYSKKAVETEETDTKTAPEEKTENKCIVCKKSLPEDTQYCPYCGAPTKTPVTFERLAPFVAADGSTEIEDGVTAKEATPIIAVNQIRYLSRFIRTGEKKKLSWNWAAFLFPHVWFSFRKMHSAAWGFSIGMIISSLLSLPFNVAVTRLPGYMDLKGGSAVLGRFVVENAHLIDRTVLILALVGSLLHIAIMLAGGLFGDKIYKSRVVRVAKEIKLSEDKETALRKKGGINLFIPLLVMAAVSYLPGIIFSLIGGI